MLLPAALESTTLGDVLGGLCRGGASGALILREEYGSTHEIGLIEGRVDRVLLARERQRLGDVLKANPRGATLAGAVERACSRASDPRPLGARLLAVRAISPELLERTVQGLHRERLEALFQLVKARLYFRPLRRMTSEHGALDCADFIVGRRRHRDRVRARLHDDAVTTFDDRHVTACRVLAVHPTATPQEIRKAYRRGVRRWHPDLFVNAEPSTVRHARRRFSELSESYLYLQSRRACLGRVWGERVNG